MRFKSMHWVLRAGLLAVIVMTIAAASFVTSQAQIPIQRVQWQPPVFVPSPLESNSWFPNLAVDSHSNVHVIWAETYRPDESDFLYESIFYSMWNGNQWSQYTDIAAPIREIRRNSLAIDRHDVLHMTFVDSFANNPYRLGYSTAQADDAFSTNNWSKVIHLNDREQTYMNEIAIYEDMVHVLYEDTGAYGNACSGCADMFYRRSNDGGISWDTPLSLMPSAIGTARPHLSVDSQGNLYASWDEGWDRHSGRGEPEYGVYTFSRDQGETWADPIQVRYPGNNTQLAIEGDGSGGIMLVWRTTSPDFPGVYYLWTSDFGATWTQPATLPSFNTRPSINYFDSFDMVTDSAGHIHLFATGYLMSSGERVGESSGLYHFEWDGQRWYPPTQVYNGGLIAEYPRVVLEGGNQLHVTWFVRHSAYEDVNTHQIMYTRGLASAPAVSVTPVISTEIEGAEASRPLAADMIPEATPGSRLPTPTFEPTPVVPASSLFTEWDEYLLLLIGIVPAGLVMGAAAVIILRKRRPGRR